jgi:hypothetical protein
MPSDPIEGSDSVQSVAGSDFVLYVAQRLGCMRKFPSLRYQPRVLIMQWASISQTYHGTALLDAVNSVPSLPRTLRHASPRQSNFPLHAPCTDLPRNPSPGPLMLRRCDPGWRKRQVSLTGRDQERRRSAQKWARNHRGGRRVAADLILLEKKTTSLRRRRLG